MDRLLSPKRSTLPTLTDFKRRIYRRYQHSHHLQAIDDLLTSITRYVETGGREGIGRAIIEMPPRHGKTLTTSRLYPTWHLGRNPDHRIILVSYGADLAEKNSRAARNLIASPFYRETFGGIALASDSKSAAAWDIAGHEGGLDAMGIGGGVTGKGAHVLIIDDPIKNREQAESETWRDKVWDSYGDDLYTRLEPGGAVVVMMTRWHEDDLIGRLLKHEPDRWHRLRMPAIDDDGAALWSDRYPIDVLRDIEATLGPYSFSALYQQNPVPAEGGIFKRAWFEPPLDRLPTIVHTVRYWDLAMSEKTAADYTVGVKLGTGEDGHTYLLDVARKQLEWGDVTPFLAETMLADGASVAQGIEEKGYMSRAVTELNADPRLHGYSVFGYPADKDKLTRALPFAARCAAGQVHVLNRHWTQAYLDEVCSFPNAAHDDQVDASSGAWGMLGDAFAPQSGEVRYADNGGFSQSAY